MAKFKRRIGFFISICVFGAASLSYAATGEESFALMQQEMLQIKRDFEELATKYGLLEREYSKVIEARDILQTQKTTLLKKIDELPVECLATLSGSSYSNSGNAIRNNVACDNTANENTVRENTELKAAYASCAQSLAEAESSLKSAKADIKFLEDTLQKQNSTNESDAAKVRQELKARREKITQLEKDLSTLSTTQKENSDLKNKVTLLMSEVSRLSQEISKNSEIKKQFDDSQNQITKIQTSVQTLTQELTQSSEHISRYKSELKSELENKEKLKQMIADLNKQLLEANNLIVIKDTAIKDLEQRTSCAAPTTNNISQNQLQNRRNQRFPVNTTQTQVATTNTPMNTPTPPPANAAFESVILEVIANKANLRSGQGEEHSPVMEILKGTRLVAETRHGEWYRVVTPTGGRAFIRADVVQVLQDNTQSSNYRTNTSNPNNPYARNRKNISVPEISFPNMSNTNVQNSNTPNQGILNQNASPTPPSSERQASDEAAFELLKRGLTNPPPAGSASSTSNSSANPQTDTKHE